MAAVRQSLAALDMATKEEVLAGIYQNRVFENFGEVEALMSSLRDVCYYPVKFKERRTVTTHNKTVSHIVIIVCFGSI